MTTLVVGVVALLAVLVPGVRDQIALSATHEPQEYVALSFGRTARDTVVTCTTTGGQVRVAFVVTSALSETRTLDYALTVGARRTTGSVTVEPGESADVTRLVPRPRTKRYDIEVRVEDRRILAHCGGAS